MPCIRDIEQNCVVFDMDSQTDFRMLGHLGDAAYVVDQDTPGTGAKLHEVFKELTEGWTARPLRLMTQGKLLRLVF